MNGTMGRGRALAAATPLALLAAGCWTARVFSGCARLPRRPGMYPCSSRSDPAITVAPDLLSRSKCQILDACLAVSSSHIHVGSCGGYLYRRDHPVEVGPQRPRRRLPHVPRHAHAIPQVRKARDELRCIHPPHGRQVGSGSGQGSLSTLEKRHCRVVRVSLQHLHEHVFDLHDVHDVHDLHDLQCAQVQA